MSRVLDITLLGEELSSDFVAALDCAEKESSNLQVNLFHGPWGFDYSVPSPMVILKEDKKVLRREYGMDGLNLIKKAISYNS